jgi:hypothetical protein
VTAAPASALAKRCVIVAPGGRRSAVAGVQGAPSWPTIGHGQMPCRAQPSDATAIRALPSKRANAAAFLSDHSPRGSKRLRALRAAPRDGACVRLFVAVASDVEAATIGPRGRVLITH